VSLFVLCIDDIKDKNDICIESMMKEDHVYHHSIIYLLWRRVAMRSPLAMYTSSMLAVTIVLCQLHRRRLKNRTLLMRKYTLTLNWPIDSNHQVSLIVRDVVIMNKRIEKEKKRDRRMQCRHSSVQMAKKVDQTFTDQFVILLLPLIKLNRY
jgi:hypothetical protein